ncbi:MAG TPA: hypothetical protein VFH27_01000, partial [Longimicrobiaceae bacterium]|nr:hypothetical protein [Longimicrobiaceae bacterium]
MRFLPRVSLLLAALLAALAFTPRSASAQEAPPGYEQGIYDLRIAGLNPVSVPVLLDRRGAVLVPLRPLLELTGAPFRVVPDSGLAVVSRPRGAGQATLDERARTLTTDRRVPLDSTDALATADEVYATTARAAQLLEAQVEVDAAELTVRFTRVVPFPAQERLETDARRELEALQGGGGPVIDPRTVPFVPRSGGAVFEWGVSSSFPSSTVPSAANASVGLGVYGGMLELGAAVSNPGGGIPPSADPTARYRRVFPLGRRVRQVQLGDFATENLRARSVRGVSLTNAPFIRDPLFGEIAFDPHLPAGWDYEVYQNGRLLGFPQGTTKGPIAIPLGYGSTPVRIRLYGPAGERVESEVVYLVPVIQLPAGRFQYAVGGGQCRRQEECGSMGYVDLRHGVSRTFTAFAGADVLRDSTVRVKPYGGVSFIPARAWSVVLQGMAGSFFQGAIQSLGTSGLSGSLSAGITLPELQDRAVVGGGGFPTLPGLGTRWNVDAATSLRTSGGGGLLHSLSATGRLEGTREGGLTRARASLLASLRSVILEAAGEHSVFAVDTAGVRTMTDLGSLRATLPLTALSGALPRGAIVSAEVGGSAAGLQRAELGGYAQTGPVVLNLVGRWDAQARSPSLVVSSTIRLGYGRAQGRIASQAGRMAGGVTISGAAAYSPGAGLTPLPYGGLGQAGIAGIVYHDVNGNGRMDAGDEPVPDARVFVGGALVRTDSTGRYATWSVLPYEVAPVRVDTVGLQDPSWVPAREGIAVRPSPHLFTRVDLPLLQTRELAGQLVPGRGVRAAAGLTVEIVAAGGAVVQRAVSFSD